MEDKISALVLQKFASLPSKFKPARDRKGTSHWVPLSGIVMSCAYPLPNCKASCITDVRHSKASSRHDEGRLECLALATGAKCLPASVTSLAKGRVLHDSHAEILSIRALNHFLIEESGRMIADRTHKSSYLRWRREHEFCTQRGFQPLTIHDEIRLHMYCSEAPCGDASMELTMCDQDDATPWQANQYLAEKSASDGALKGRGHFSELGVVRRKPARGDCEPTLSKSCSDKLALKQGTSLLSGPTSLLISPENAYLDTLILPESRYNAVAVERAFGVNGRLESLSGRAWSSGYAFRSFRTSSTSEEFLLSQSNIRRETSHPKVSNLCAIWTPTLQEVLVNGVRQGKKQSDLTGASALSRSKAATQAISKATLLELIPHGIPQGLTYAKFKALEVLRERKVVKEDVIRHGLCNWVNNRADDFRINE